MGDGTGLTELPDRVQKFLVDYAVNFYEVVAVPRSAFNPDNPEMSAANAASVLRALGFASLSIVLSGILWQGFVPDGGGAVKSEILLFVLLSWVIFSCFYYIAAKILGGSASIFASLQTTLIVKSVIYLFAFFVSIGILLGFSVGAIYFAVVAFSIYEVGIVVFVPIALSTLNAFSLIRSLCLATLILLITLFPIILFLVEIIRAAANFKIAPGTHFS
jgi:hypothetical protein